jgi:polysaccharide biosynthesis/export protein
MRWSVVLIALLLPAVSGCAINRMPRDVATPQVYNLDTGDVVRVTVYGDSTITNIYTVTDRGTISLPLAGDVPVRGETIAEAQKAIITRLANGFIISPQVSVEVTTYRPFFIDGAVDKGGQFPYVWGMTARAAIATSGGYKDYADRTKVTIYRKAGKQTLKFVTDPDTPIMPGDTVVVGERWL